MTNRSTSVSARLSHDYRAHIRAIQMSQKSVFVYCEGRTHDPYIYAEFVRRSRLNHEGFYCTHRVEDVTGTGGKKAVLGLYSRFKRQNLLVSEFKGKKFCALFFVDKDVDDLKRAVKKWTNLFYTDLYDLEGQIYRDTDLRHAVAVGLSIDINEVPPEYHNPKDWIERKAKKWEKWILLCAGSELLATNCGCGYGRSSRINKSLLGEVNMEIFEEFKRALQHRSGLTQSKFDAIFKKLERHLGRLEKANNLAGLFKGKWLESIIEAELAIKFKGKAVNIKNVGSRISGVAASSFDFSSNWAGHQIRSIRDILSTSVGI